jgi:hypothetical protein
MALNPTNATMFPIAQLPIHCSLFSAHCSLTGLPMDILLLDETIRVKVYFEPSDADFSDNICMCFEEACPEEEKIFRAAKTHVYLTREQARMLALALYQAADRSQVDSVPEGGLP